MDPNNNQPINTNPFGQPAHQSVDAPMQPQQPAPPVAPVSSVVTPITTSQVPGKGSKKGIILVVILIILILGMVSYVLFAKNQLNTARKTVTDNTSTVIPTVTITPTAGPATVDEIIVESPDADLNGIEQDVQGL